MFVVTVPGITKASVANFRKYFSNFLSRRFEGFVIRGISAYAFYPQFSNQINVAYLCYVDGAISSESVLPEFCLNQCYPPAVLFFQLVHFWVASCFPVAFPVILMTFLHSQCRVKGKNGPYFRILCFPESFPRHRLKIVLVLKPIRSQFYGRGLLVSIIRQSPQELIEYLKKALNSEIGGEIGDQWSFAQTHRQKVQMAHNVTRILFDNSRGSSTYGLAQ